MRVNDVSRLFLIGLLGLCAGTAVGVRGDTLCGDCHQAASSRHAGQLVGCAACHRGDEHAVDAARAHAGLIRRPGQLGRDVVGCAGCHAEQVGAVSASPMHTGHGMVYETRRAFGDALGSVHSLQTLGHGIADSLLRKLCASCHLGQPGNGATEPLQHRGGGCLACHLDPVAPEAHASLTARVDDARCVGCHSRSGRISLSYAGLAEVDPPVLAEAWQGLSRLADGRLVEHRAADAHHAAGMGCTDCHTGAGLMGQVGGIDIACADCHANTRARLSAGDLAPGQRARVPFPVDGNAAFVQTANGTGLWHVEVSDEGLRLYPKAGGQPVRVPQAGPGHYAEPDAHANLTCDACHAVWAPQCHGCHTAYDADDVQWDHVERETTPGRWRERRWGVRNGAPPLGIDAAGRVRPVVPGMIMTLEHPELDQPLFRRDFATLSPHTTGPSRSCEDCHGNPVALGLGAGKLFIDDAGSLRFSPVMSLLEDGLPADAWTGWPVEDTRTFPRGIQPFSREQIKRLAIPRRERIEPGDASL